MKSKIQNVSGYWVLELICDLARLDSAIESKRVLGIWNFYCYGRTLFIERHQKRDRPELSGRAVYHHGSLVHAHATAEAGDADKDALPAHGQGHRIQLQAGRNG